MTDLIQFTESKIEKKPIFLLGNEAIARGAVEAGKPMTWDIERKLTQHLMTTIQTRTVFVHADPENQGIVKGKEYNQDREVLVHGDRSSSR